MGESSDATAPVGAPVRQFSVFLRNETGCLEALIQLLHQSRVELLGFSMQDSRDATVARIVTSDPDSTEQVFLEKGIPHSSADLVVVALRHAAEEFQKCLRELRLAETNLDFGYTLLPHPEGRTMVALHVEDVEFAQSVLHAAGVQTVTQEELSR
ncbi:MAG: hypothetical protein CMO40_07775 [Verrucomicrobiaceae bacterium]|nr:hypothetical protein [Verrucomicrobiaceae bacterium]